jgi:uncharacterized membrane protein
MQQGFGRFPDALRTGRPRFSCESDYAAQVALAFKEVDGFSEKDFKFIMTVHNSVAMCAHMVALTMLTQKWFSSPLKSTLAVRSPNPKNQQIAPRYRMSLYNRRVLTDAISEEPELKTAHKPLRLKTFLMILVMVVTGPLGNVLLGKGMKHVGAVAVWPPSQLLQTSLKIFASTSIWLGISSLIVFFVSYMLVLSWADYSFVQPASSLAYGVVALLSYLVLGEAVSPMRWAGIAVICLGVFVISHTAPRTTSAETAR